MTEEENQEIEQKIIQMYRDGEFYCNYLSGQLEQSKKMKDIVELNSQGLMNSEIARQLDVSQSSVSYYLNKGGLPRNKTESQKKSEMAQEAVLKYHEKGWTDKKIAENIDCNPKNPVTFVKYHLEKHGLGQNVTPKQYNLFQKVVELNQQGWNKQDIAKYLFTGAGVIGRVTYSLGLESNEYQKVEKHEDAKYIDDKFRIVSPYSRFKRTFPTQKVVDIERKEMIDRYIDSIDKAIQANIDKAKRPKQAIFFKSPRDYLGFGK